MDLDSVEIRVLGCLVEKQRTTPDVYPLSLNALRVACNQSTNRDPVVDYDEPTIRSALDRLSRRGWVRLASGPGSRAVKFRHLLDDALDLPEPELALLTVLMLRGAQTPGELKQRADRLYPFESLAGVEQTMTELIGRELVVRQPRRPGQKEQRYSHLLGGESVEGEAEPSVPAPADDRIGRLEERVARLEEELAALRETGSPAG
jgi:uncharacterized protein YceH (UPF0502 family)